MVLASLCTNLIWTPITMDSFQQLFLSQSLFMMSVIQKAFPRCFLEEDVTCHQHCTSIQGQIHEALIWHQQQLQFNILAALQPELGDWVKSRNLAWFSIFVMTEFDDKRWIQNFRMTKSTFVQLCFRVAPLVQKKNTNFRPAIPVIARVACTLYKLAHGASYVTCSEKFAIGISTVSEVIQDVVLAINIVCKGMISWPKGEKMKSVMDNFKALCGLPSVHGAIDGCHIPINRPPGHMSDDYFCYKTKGYSLNMQAVVDSRNHFIDLVVGLPGTVNDARMLRRSALYRYATEKNLFHKDFVPCHSEYPPYLLGDGGYALLPWLMVPHQRRRRLSLLESVFNKKLSTGRAVVEHTFGIMKKIFREFLHRSEMKTNHVIDAVVACCLLHNCLMEGRDVDLEYLFEVIEAEARENQDPPQPHYEDDVHDEADHQTGADLRESLQLYLAQHRQQL